MTMHLGDLFTHEWKSTEALSIAHESLMHLIAVVTPDAESVMPGLVLPLNFTSGERYGTEFEPPPSGRDDIGMAICNDETPYIFVVRRDTHLALHPWHGYREPLDAFLPWAEAGQIYSYYEVSRGEEAIRVGWMEFQRSIISEYYPASLVPRPGQQ